jgi:hypothetical protein
MTIWGTDPYEEPSECSRSREKLNEILDEERERDVREREEKMLKQEEERHEKRKAAEEEEAKEERREQEK